MSLLDELFGQILQSEESITQRFDQLKEVHTSILEYQAKIKDAEFQIQSLRGTIAVKNQKLVEKEVEFKWLVSKKNLLRSKILEQEEIKAGKLKEINQVKKMMENERLEFIKEAKEFSKTYEFSTDFESEYEKCLKRQLEEIKLQKEEMEKECEMLETQHLKTSSLKKRIETVNRSITSLMFMKDEKEVALQRSKKETENLKAKMEEVEKIPQNSFEFQRLSEELSTCLKRSEELCKRRDALSIQLYNSNKVYTKRDANGKIKQLDNTTSNEKTERSTIEGENSKYSGSGSVFNQQGIGRVNLFKSTRLQNGRPLVQEPGMNQLRNSGKKN